MLIVFDMDGTLSDPSHRLHHLAKKDWDSFYEACHLDAPKDQIQILMLMYWRAGCDVQIWTGRRESTRAKTLDWLKNHTGLRFPSDKLLMRKDGDFRHDVKVKGEWLDAVSEKPSIVFEDRNSMVEFYRSKGITCLQVADGDF
jgi:beta-phosphoglucomutase-like phosphatase (HAD superfamily)